MKENQTVQKHWTQTGSLMNSTKDLWEKLYQLSIIYQRTEGGIHPNSFYEASITLIPKPKISQEKETTGQYCSRTQMQKSTKYKQTESNTV